MAADHRGQQADGDGSTHSHTFHLPNSYARSQISDGNQVYTAVPGDEADVNEDSDQAILTGVGVETCESWHAMSAIQHGLVRAAFGILGATVLLPFNALITPSEYYRSLLAGTTRENTFMSWLIAVYNVSCIAFGIHATISMQKGSVSRRIVSSALVIIAVLLATTVLIGISGRPRAEPSSFIFPFMISLSLLLAAATSYLQLAIVNLANASGPSCMGTMLSGQGVVGASVSLVQLIAAVSARQTSRSEVSSLEQQQEAQNAAVGFFAANTAFMVFGLGIFFVLTRTSIYRDMHSKMAIVKGSLAAILAQEAAQEEEDEDRIASVAGINRYMGRRTQKQFARIVLTQKKAILACLSIAYIFIITLAIFPALTARVRSTSKTPTPTIVFVALHFFVFNLGDLIGRSLPSILPQIFLLQGLKLIVACCVLRTGFIPLLSFCNVSAGHATAPSSPLGDLFFFTLMVLLGLSNGLLATSIFVVGPRQPNLTLPSDQDLAAGLLSWWLTFGLAIGSLASFIVAGTV